MNKKLIKHKYARLTPKQIRALPLLASGLSAKEVSKRINISQAQISAWRQDTVFMAALDDYRRNAMREAEAALSGLAMDAVQALRESLTSASSDQTRLRAAIYIIDRFDFSSSVESEIPRSVNMNLLLTALGTQQVTPE